MEEKSNQDKGLRFPLGTIKKLIKKNLYGNAIVSNDFVDDFSKSLQVFIHYLSAT